MEAHTKIACSSPKIEILSRVSISNVRMRYPRTLAQKIVWWSARQRHREHTYRKAHKKTAHERWTRYRLYTCMLFFQLNIFSPIRNLFLLGLLSRHKAFKCIVRLDMVEPESGWKNEENDDSRNFDSLPYFLRPKKCNNLKLHPLIRTACDVQRQSREAPLVHRCRADHPERSASLMTRLFIQRDQNGAKACCARGRRQPRPRGQTRTHGSRRR